MCPIFSRFIFQVALKSFLRLNLGGYPLGHNDARRLKSLYLLRIVRNQPY